MHLFWVDFCIFLFPVSPKRVMIGQNGGGYAYERLLEILRYHRAGVRSELSVLPTVWKNPSHRTGAFTDLHPECCALVQAQQAKTAAAHPGGGHGASTS